MEVILSFFLSVKIGQLRIRAALKLRLHFVFEKYFIMLN